MHCAKLRLHPARLRELFFFVSYRIVSAPSPLPLMPAPNNALGSTVRSMSGSGARGTSMRHTTTTTTMFRERAVKG